MAAAAAAAAAFVGMDCGGIGIWDRTAASTESIGLAGRRSIGVKGKMSARAAMANLVADGSDHSIGSGLVKKNRSNGGRNRAPISPEKLDEWTRDSVSEIVRNIGEAPFLVHVFSNDEDSLPSSTVRLETEHAVSMSWPWIRRGWEEGSRSLPDGIILVEELKDEEEKQENEDFTEPSTRKWGILVQGRGVDCSACYILNTCRVLSCGWASTHFCLVRAQCFGDSADVQLRKAWLQQ